MSQKEPSPLTLPGAGEEIPDASKFAVCDLAEIKDGFLIITASFDKRDNPSLPTREFFPYKERRIKISERLVITTYDGTSLGHMRDYTFDEYYIRNVCCK